MSDATQFAYYETEHPWSWPLAFGRRCSSRQFFGGAKNSLDEFPQICRKTFNAANFPLQIFSSSWLLMSSHTLKYEVAIIKSSRISIGFRGLIRLGSAFIFAVVQTCTYLYSRNYSPHVRQNKKSICKILMGNGFHVKLRIVSLWICYQCQQVKRCKVKTRTEKQANSWLKWHILKLKIEVVIYSFQSWVSFSALSLGFQRFTC